MPISVRKDPYVIPTYSLTGDLLSFLKCPRQYRYYNRGALPPSAPVQLWFGEFIHGVMEEAFDRWKVTRASTPLPWLWEDHIRDIEMTIFRRLAGRGLTPPPPLFRRYEEDREPDRRIASFRAEAAINTWGPHLFPLIEEAEVRLSGTRPMPQFEQRRADYYGVTGVIDVVSSVRLREVSRENRLLKKLLDIPSIEQRLRSSDRPFDVIVDYKGMRRPGFMPGTESLWDHQEWQVQTYAWLRKLQAPDRETVAGLLVYINELYPSAEDLRALRREVRRGETDILPIGEDLNILMSGPLSRRSATKLSRAFREERGVRVVLVDPTSPEQSLVRFDRVVARIEQNVALERSGRSLTAAWSALPETATCTACDFKYRCDGVTSREFADQIGARVTVP